MQEIKVKIKGKTPYLMHAFQLVQSEEKSKNRSGIEDYKGQVENSLYRLPDGTIYVPSTQIHGCLTEAGKQFQIPGKRKATFSRIIGSTIMVTPDAIPMNPQNYEIDTRAVVNPATKGRVARHRPKFIDWKLEFVIENLEPEYLPTTELKKILDYGGSYVGIGDFRPQKKGMFGRFIVTLFEY